MSITNIIVFISLIIFLPAIFIAGLKKPAHGLAILIFALPALSQARRLFIGSQMPLFSMETLAVVILWIAVQIRSLKIRPPSKKGILLRAAILVFLLTGFISAFLSSSPEISYKIWFVGGVVPILCFFIASSHISDRQDATVVILAYFGLVVQTLIFSILAFNVRQSIAPTEIDIVDWFYSNQINASIAFGSPSATASVIVAAIPLAAWYRITRNANNNLTWAIVTTATIGVAALSLSRGSWLGITVGFVLSLPLYFKRVRISTILLFIALIVVVYFSGFYDFIFQAINYRLGSTVNTIDIRLANYELALEASGNYLLWGLGLGNYSYIYSQFPYSLASTMTPLWFAHSLFLTLIPEVGMIGSLAFVYIFVAQIRRSFYWFQNISDPQGRWLMYAISAALLSYIVIASTSGTHIVATLSDYLIAPALIVVFTILGMIPSNSAYFNK